MENSLHIAFFLCNLDTFIHISLHSRIGFEIAVDKFFGFFPFYVHPFGEAEYGYTIDNAEIGSFGFATHIGAYILQVNLINLCGGGSVDVMVAEESVDHVLILAQMRHDAQFNL